MSAHLFRQRVNIHPPPECWIIIPRPKIIKVNIKLLLIFLPAKLKFIRIPHIRRGWNDRNVRARAFKTNDSMVGLVTLMLQAKGIIMTLLQRLRLACLGVRGIFETDVAKVVCVVIYIMKRISRSASSNIGWYSSNVSLSGWKKV